MHTVVVESAIALSAEQKKELKSILTKKVGKDAEITERINPDILGGLRVTIGSKRIDLSLSGRLAQVQHQLV